MWAQKVAWSCLGTLLEEGNSSRTENQPGSTQDVNSPKAPISIEMASDKFSFII